MKKLALALISLSAAIFGFGVVSQAQAQSFPFGQLWFGNILAGQPFEVRSNCVPGTGDVSFGLNIGPYGTVVSQSRPCVLIGADAGPAGLVMGFMGQTTTGGIATATFTAPVAPGTYSGTATQNGVVVGSGSFTIAGQTGVTVPAAPGAPVTVPGGGLPATGSGGIDTTTTIAIGLLVVGLGLFVVAQVRRRQPHPA